MTCVTQALQSTEFSIKKENFEPLTNKLFISVDLVFKTLYMIIRKIPSKVCFKLSWHLVLIFIDLGRIFQTQFLLVIDNFQQFCGRNTNAEV